jgi:hypothetical protein
MLRHFDRFIHSNQRLPAVCVNQVSNESSEIVRILNDFKLGDSPVDVLDLYPEGLRSEIDSINGWISDEINTCVVPKLLLLDSFTLINLLSQR